MSYSIEVYRGDGLRQGRDVVEPLLSDTALLFRGVAEMDANAQQHTTVDVDLVYRDGVRLGQLVELLDISTSKSFRAKVVGINIVVSLGDASLKVTLERPL